MLLITRRLKPVLQIIIQTGYNWAWERKLYFQIQVHVLLNWITYNQCYHIKHTRVSRAQWPQLKMLNNISSPLKQNWNVTGSKRYERMKQTSPLYLNSYLIKECYKRGKQNGNNFFSNKLWKDIIRNYYQ